LRRPFPATPIDPPTLAMTFRINDSPLAGREGEKVHLRVIRDRLLARPNRNVAIKRHRNRNDPTPSKSPAAANFNSAC
jgi:GTP-binding protein